MKKINIIYWVFTGLMALAIISSSIPDLMVTPEAVAIFKHLLYPEYLIRFSAIAKILAIIVILYPGFPRLKEWAYAGLVFDLTGAVFGGISVGDPILQWWPLSIFYILIAGSYIFYHKKLKETSINSRESTIKIKNA